MIRYKCKDIQTNILCEDNTLNTLKENIIVRRPPGAAPCPRVAAPQPGAAGGRPLLHPLLHHVPLPPRMLRPRHHHGRARRAQVGWDWRTAGHVTSTRPCDWCSVPHCEASHLPVWLTVQGASTCGLFVILFCGDTNTYFEVTLSIPMHVTWKLKVSTIFRGNIRIFAIFGECLLAPSSD